MLSTLGLFSHVVWSLVWLQQQNFTVCAQSFMPIFYKVFLWHIMCCHLILQFYILPFLSYPAPTVVFICVKVALLLFAVIYLFHNSTSVWFIFSSRLLRYTFRSLVSTFSSQGDRGESDLDSLLEFSLAESKVMRLNALFEYSSSRTFGYAVTELSWALLLAMISLCLFNPGCTLKKFWLQEYLESCIDPSITNVLVLSLSIFIVAEQKGRLYSFHMVI